MELYDIDRYNEMEHRLRLNELFAQTLHKLLDLRHELDATNDKERDAKERLSGIEAQLTAMQAQLCRP